MLTEIPGKSVEIEMLASNLADHISENELELNCAVTLHDFIHDNNISGYDEEYFIGSFYESLRFKLDNYLFHDSVTNSYKGFVEANKNNIPLDELHDIVWSDFVHINGFGNDFLGEFRKIDYYEKMFGSINEVFSVLPKPRQTFINGFNASIVGDSLSASEREKLSLIERIHDLGVITQSEAVQIDTKGYSSVLSCAEKDYSFALAVIAHLLFLGDETVSEFAAAIDFNNVYLPIRIGNILGIYDRRTRTKPENTREFGKSLISIIEQNSKGVYIDDWMKKSVARYKSPYIRIH